MRRVGPFYAPLSLEGIVLTIVYQSPWPIGGFAYYTAHLWRTMAAQAEIVRIGSKDESRPRTHALGFPYHIITLDTLLKRQGPILLAAHDPKMPQDHADLLLARGAWRVFHDPDDFGKYPIWNNHMDGERVICIRENGLQHLAGATYIPHPYVQRRDTDRLPMKPYAARDWNAVSTAMISKRKNSQIILAANELVAEERRCVLHGLVERWFKMDYPAVESHPCRFGRHFDAGVQILRNARIQVDLSVFKNDGGGTQYTFLEGMDAGCKLIAHQTWLDYPGRLKDVAYGVTNAQELADMLIDDTPYDQERGWDYLNQHHKPDNIRKQYLETTGAI